MLTKPFDLDKEMIRLDKFILQEKIDRINPLISFLLDCRNVISYIRYNWNDFPRDGYRKIKRGIQRAYRGWSDEDVWSVHHYHAKVIVGMLKRLKETKQGTPMAVFPESAKLRENGNITDEEEKIGQDNWNKILDKMINAYSFNLAIAEGERELCWPRMSAKSKKEFKCLSKEEEKERQEGMKLFNKYYLCLWD